MLIDTHSHINFRAYDKDRDEVVKRASEAGVVCIDVGTKYETSQRAVELAQKYENVYASIGLHPIHIKTDLMKLRLDENEGAFAPLGEEFDYEKYKELAKNKKIVAIGEIGLDYYYRPKTKSRQEQFKENQKKVFIRQLDLAKELNLPVIFHCRMAHTDAVSILKNYQGIRGVMHCFTGTAEEMQEYLKLGFYIGFNGIIFSALGGPALGGKLPLDEVIKQCPLDKILIETDCPYLTPPSEGKDKRNEPIFVKHVAKRISELKGTNFEQVCEETSKNARNLFGI